MSDYQHIISKYTASQNPIELNKLFQRIGELKPRHIAVLGIENGELLRLLREAFSPEILIGIDSHIKEIEDSVASIIYGNPVDPEIFDKVVDRLSSKHLDFIFFNHDKSFEGLKSEYFLYRDLVREGGIIAMDSIRLKSPSYHMAGIDVSDFWSSIIRDNRINYYEFWDVGINGYGPGIGMHYKL